MGGLGEGRDWLIAQPIGPLPNSLIPCAPMVAPSTNGTPHWNSFGHLLAGPVPLHSLPTILMLPAKRKGVYSARDYE